MNNPQTQPFGLPLEITWILGILVPMFGWFIVFFLNKSNLRHEKMIMIKIHAFDYIKGVINNLLTSGSELQSFLFITKSTLEFSNTNNNLLNNCHNDRLLEEFGCDKFNKLKDRFNNDFCKFIFSWEQYEIVFKKIVIQRYALQEEFSQVIDESTKVWGEYDAYMLSLKSGLPLANESREKLITSIQDLFIHTLDFTACISDVNHNLQNYVFGKILNESNDKRIVKNQSCLTIDSLIIKHAVKLQNYYEVKLKKRMV